MFLDERGAGLRVTWHPERDLVVLSVWQGDSCVGTFRMLVQDVPRLSGLLAAALGDWVGETGPGASVGPGPGVGREAGVGQAVTADQAADVGRAAGVGQAADVGREPGAGGGRLSVPQRLRLSRPVLKLRGLRHRGRGSA